MKRIPSGEKARIEYPCTWVYKIFGKDQEVLHKSIAMIMPGSEYRLSLSRSSRNSRYCCMNLELTVVNDEDRLGIYEALSAHQEILLVL